MARSQSGGKRKQKPIKPPPSGPPPNKQNVSSSHNNNNNKNHNGGNNQKVPPKIQAHTKSQTVMSSSFKPQRQSPVPPPRFFVHDHVLYNGQEAEIMRILNQNQIEITYPTKVYITQRQASVVSPQQLQVIDICEFAII